VAADIAIVLFLVGAVLLGVFRGALRQLVALGAWLLAFVLSAQLRSAVADWLIAQEPDFSNQYAQMLGFALAFVVLFGIALVVIEVGGRTIDLTSRPAVDEVLGGVLMLGVALLALAALLIALSTYYAAEPRGVTAEVSFVRELNDALEESTIARALRDSLIPGVQALLGPLLPADVRVAG